MAVTISFTKATDDRTLQTELVYRCYRSSSPDIDTLDNIDANGELVATATDVSSFVINEVVQGEQLSYNVTVSDRAGNRAAYTMGSTLITPTNIESLEITDSNFFMNSGDVRQVNYAFNPGGVDNAKLNWTPSDEALATVDQNGVVTAISQGTVTITVTADTDPTFTDSVSIGIDTFDFQSLTPSTETRTFITIT